MKNDKKSTEKDVGMFRVQNKIILFWLSTLLALVVCVPERVMRF